MVPKVPRLINQEVRQEATPLRNVNLNVSTDALGGGTAKILQASAGLVNSAAGVYMDMKAKADRARVTEADRDLSDYENKSAYDPESGFMNTKGRDSFGIKDTVLSDFDKKTNEIVQGLSNQDQIDAFRSRAADRRNYIAKQIDRHTSQQLLVYNKEMNQSYRRNEQIAAIENAHDPDRISRSIERQRESILGEADFAGEDPETTKLKLKDSESKTYLGIISKMANIGDDIRAKEFFDSYKKSLTPEDKDRADKLVSDVFIKGEAQRFSDNMISKNPDNLSASLEEARKEKDTKLREEKIRKVKQVYSDVKAAKDATRSANFERAYQFIESTGGGEDLPVSLSQSLRPGDLQKLRKRQQQVRNGLAEVSDIDTLYQLELMAGTPELASEFARTNLLDYRHKLSKDDFESLLSDQNKIRNGASPSSLGGKAEKVRIVNGQLNELGIEYGKGKSKEDNARANLFRRKVDQLIAEKEAQTGKKITNEDIEKITDALSVEVITEPGFFFDTRKQVFELSPGDKAQIDFEDIPESDRSSIEAALKAQGIPITDENITTVFIDKINRTAGLNGG